MYATIHFVVVMKIFFNSYNSGVIDIGEQIETKRRQTQNRYREKRLSQMDIQFRAISTQDSGSSTPKVSPWLN